MSASPVVEAMETVAWESAHYEQPFHAQRTAKLPRKLAKLGVLALDRQAHVLDTCCGKGEALQYLHRMGFTHLSGADGLRHREWDDFAACSFTSTNVKQLPYADGEFDAITNLHALHHMGNGAGVRQFLDECYRVLKPGGKLFILDFPGSPQINLLFWALRHRIGAITPGLRNFAKIVDEEWSYLEEYLADWPASERELLSAPFQVVSWEQEVFLYYLCLQKPLVETNLPAPRPPSSSNGHEPVPPEISLVIPAFNESHRLPQTLNEIRPILDERFTRYEVIVVDDGSHDGTPDIVEQRAHGWPSLRVLRQPRNLGKGAAVRRGCLNARGDLVLFMDADHAVPLQEIDRFIEVIKQTDVDLVAGVRTYQEQESKWRRIVGLSLQILTHLIVFRKAVIDSQCGFKLFRRDAVQLIFSLCRVDGGMIDVELFYLAHLYGLKCRYAPVHWVNKAGSRINFVRCMLLDPVDMLKIRLRSAVGLYQRPVGEKRQPWSVAARATHGV